MKLKMRHAALVHISPDLRLHSAGPQQPSERRCQQRGHSQGHIQRHMQRHIHRHMGLGPTEMSGEMESWGVVFNAQIFVFFNGLAIALQLKAQLFLARQN